MAVDQPAHYRRGAQRRNLLIDAAAEVLLEQGLAALSHRAVAAHAGLPLASTTYYFSSADELRDEAVNRLAAEWSKRAGELVNALPASVDHDAAARAVVGIIGADAPPPRILLVYERYLEAARHERLRPFVVAWNAQLTRLVQEVLVRAALPAGEETASLVVAVADGAAITALAEGTSAEVAVREALGRLLSLL
ncbi:MAG: TetR/AcrR family transcriptional regulator [Propionicimonas sp.]